VSAQIYMIRSYFILILLKKIIFSTFKKLIIQILKYFYYMENVKDS
jgi:hypothetical protein